MAGATHGPAESYCRLRLPAALADSLGDSSMDLKRKIEEFNQTCCLFSGQGQSPTVRPTGGAGQATDGPRTMCQPVFRAEDRPIDPTRSLQVTTCTKDELELEEFLRHI